MNKTQEILTSLIETNRALARAIVHIESAGTCGEEELHDLKDVYFETKGVALRHGTFSGGYTPNDEVDCE